MSRPRKNLGRYKKIVHLRDVKDKNFQEIATELGITRQRVWQIYQRALKNGMANPSRNSRKVMPSHTGIGLLESTLPA